MIEEHDVLDFIDLEEDPTETPEDRADREHEEAEASNQKLLSEFNADAFGGDPLAEFNKDAF